MVDHLPRPEPLEGETRVAVSLAGVCATDLALAQGYMDFCGVPGHEFVGRALDGPLAGQRVVGEINAACGTCPRCLGRDPAGLDGRHCQARSVLGILGRPGAFAQQLRLPHGNLLPVPDTVSDEAASFTEPLAAGFALLEALPDVAGQRALVLGDGKLGLLCAMVLARAGAELELCGRHPERAEWIPGLRAFSEHPQPGSFDVVIEATGHPEQLAAAISYTRPRGRVVLKTTSSKPVSLDLAPLVVDEIQLIGSRCGRFEPALAALAAGQIDVSPLVHARFPLEQAAEALEYASQRGVLKVLVQVE